MLFKNKNLYYITISDDSRSYNILVKRSSRKSISLSVKSTGEVAIYSPMSTLESKLLEVLETNINWISSKVKEVDRKQSKNVISYLDYSKVPYLGDYIELRTGIDIGKEYILDDNVLYVRAKDELDVKLTLKSFYRNQARVVFEDNKNYWLERLPFARRDTKLIIKSMRTRWGSMSSTGRMNLNLALIRTPIECINFVIVHEFCHQKHPHHQKAFWDEVATIMPDYKKSSKLLNSYSTLDL